MRQKRRERVKAKGGQAIAFSLLQSPTLQFSFQFVFKLLGFLLSFSFIDHSVTKMIDFARVQKELQECTKDIEASGIRVTPKSDSLSHLLGIIPGPIATPYEGGTFQIDITLPGPSYYSHLLFLTLNRIAFRVST